MPDMVAATVIENISDIHKNFEKMTRRGYKRRPNSWSFVLTKEILRHCGTESIEHVTISLTPFVGMIHANQNY